MDLLKSQKRNLLLLAVQKDGKITQKFITREKNV